MASVTPLSYKGNMVRGDIAPLTDTLKVMILTASYTPSAAHNFIDDVVANEVSSAGYTAGGPTLGSKSITEDSGNARAYLDGADISLPGVTFSCRYLILYKSTGNNATSPIMQIYDLGSTKTFNGDTAYFEWPAPASGGMMYVA